MYEVDQYKIGFVIDVCIYHLKKIPQRFKNEDPSYFSKNNKQFIR